MSHQKPVLLVEDNPDEERLALLGLKRAGVNCPVDIARDGEEAIKRIDFYKGEGLALVLLDLKLPKVSGHDVLAHIRTVYEDAPPVIVFTSSDEPIDISRSEQLGATEFVTKPIDFNEYVSAIKKIAATWLN